MDKEKLSGLRITKNRTAVIEALENAEMPMTAQEIHEKIRVSIPTVYRILETLCEKGIAARSAILDSKTASYEIVRHRHYAVCLGCKKIKPLLRCPLRNMSDEIDDDGFEITGHKIEVYGYCRDCRNKGDKE